VRDVDRIVDEDDADDAEDANANDDASGKRKHRGQRDATRGMHADGVLE
jgi:hypothetical protein